MIFNYNINSTKKKGNFKIITHFALINSWFALYLSIVLKRKGVALLHMQKFDELNPCQPPPFTDQDCPRPPIHSHPNYNQYRSFMYFS